MDEDITLIQDSCDLVRKVFGSDKRIRIFERITNGANRDELKEEFDDATLSQTIKRLGRELGLVEQTDHELSLTPLGEEISTELLATYSKAKLITRLRPFLDQIPDWNQNLCNLDYLEDAHLEVEGDVFGDSHLRRYTQRIRESEKSRELVAQLTPASEVYGAKIIEDGMDCEFVGSAQIVEALEGGAESSGEFIERWERTEEMGTKYFVVDEELPYTLTIFDDEVVTILPTSSEGPDALLETSNEAVVEWALETYDGYRRDAERVHPPQGGQL